MKIKKLVMRAFQSHLDFLGLFARLFQPLSKMDIYKCPNFISENSNLKKRQKTRGKIPLSVTFWGNEPSIFFFEYKLGPIQ